MVKTLHARAASAEKDFEGYEGESEPNMKFSHALIVVLILHILAVGGVFAFNALQGQRPAKPATKTAPVAQTVAPPEVTTKSPTSSAVSPDTATSPSAAKSSPKAPAATDGATYTVLAGDTLTRIAAAHKTTVEALEQANGIVANSAIRVGQILKIPAKTTTSKPTATALKPAESRPQAATKTPDVASAPNAKSPALKPAPAAKSPEVRTTPAMKTGEVQASEKSPAGSAEKPDAKPASKDKTYTVAKGDNPYSIAKKLKISYNELIKANKIEDPTKLQIGQQLIIP